VIEVREYLAPDGTSPYAKWFDSLNAQAAAKVATAVTRMAQGNLSNTKRVGAGVHDIASILDLVIESILVRTVSVW
jgi:putative component of toxin-antitoxin plasmid stabilization module